METGTIVVIGAVGVGAFWLWRRSRVAVPTPGREATPIATSNMTNSAAAATQAGGAVVAGIARTAIVPMDLGFPGGSSGWTGAPSTGISVRRQAGQLAVQDATPPPPPVFNGLGAGGAYATTLGVSPTRGFGATAMGPQPSDAFRKAALYE